jgi:hypothetical protein
MLQILSNAFAQGAVPPAWDGVGRLFPSIEKVYEAGPSVN